jgi:hypothetical protein
MKFEFCVIFYVTKYCSFDLFQPFDTEPLSARVQHTDRWQDTFSPREKFVEITLPQPWILPGQRLSYQFPIPQRSISPQWINVSPTLHQTSLCLLSVRSNYPAPSQTAFPSLTLSSPSLKAQNKTFRLVGGIIVHSASCFFTCLSAKGRLKLQF